MPQYVSLLGKVCFTNSNKHIIYPKELLEIFTDPITLEIVKSPIIMNDTPFHIYDSNSLFKWLLTSDINPLTGEHMKNKEFEVTIVNNYIMAMLLLEEHENYLIFHQPNCDLINFINLAHHIVNYKKEQFENVEMPDLDINENLHILDIDAYYKNRSKISLVLKKPIKKFTYTYNCEIEEESDIEEKSYINVKGKPHQ
jgi:hypothetical protein